MSYISGRDEIIDSKIKLEEILQKVHKFTGLRSEFRVFQTRLKEAIFWLDQADSMMDMEGPEIR